MAFPAPIDELEAQILTLSAEERARLAGVLIRSLTPDDEVAAAWLDEAERRDRQMGDDPQAGSPADQVLQRARARN